MIDRGNLKLVEVDGAVRLVDTGTGTFLELDEAEWFWLNVCAAPLAVATLRRRRAEAEGGPEAAGGAASGARDATDPEDGQLLLDEVVDAVAPAPPKRRQKT